MIRVTTLLQHQAVRTADLAVQRKRLHLTIHETITGDRNQQGVEWCCGTESVKDAKQSLISVR